MNRKLHHEWISKDATGTLNQDQDETIVMNAEGICDCFIHEFTADAMVSAELYEFMYW